MIDFPLFFLMAKSLNGSNHGPISVSPFSLTKTHKNCLISWKAFIAARMRFSEFKVVITNLWCCSSWNPIVCPSLPTRSKPLKLKTETLDANSGWLITLFSARYSVTECPSQTFSISSIVPLGKSWSKKGRQHFVWACLTVLLPMKWRDLLPSFVICFLLFSL